ncbi:MAG: hypothetical protein ACT4NY_22775 [Pseudonocardiales bacterium]
MTIDGDYPIKYSIVRDEAHFEIGKGVARVNLLASPEGLGKLVTTASEALRTMRASADQGASRPG